ncbi:MAG: sterol desaturase family protein [Candidatus Eremiobacteraeota bacterium]|nr:sterol desaturase family protein [Candidatus Eremiobacteraeota bacterium]
MILTFLRHGSNALIVAAVAVLVVLGAARYFHLTIWAGALGAAAFFISEYTTHRFLFHAEPSKVPFVRSLQHRLHYDHHVEPSRLDLLFLPPWFVIPVALAFFGAYVAIVRNGDLALSLLSGSLAALLYYEWVHYVAHIPSFVPKTPFGRWIKKYHLWHHFKNERLWYGVTNPSMDFVGRTYLRVNDADMSGTTKYLFR